MRSSVSDLHAAHTNGRRKETERAHAAEKRQQQVEMSASTAAPKKRKTGSKAGVGVFSLEEGRTPAPSFSEDEIRSLCCDGIISASSSPFGFRGVRWAAGFAKGATYAGELSSFAKQFDEAQAKQGLLRGQLKLQSPWSATSETMCSTCSRRCHGARGMEHVLSRWRRQQYRLPSGTRVRRISLASLDDGAGSGDG